MATNVSIDGGAAEVKYTRAELLKWLNESLNIKYNQIEQTCSGACFCQMMHWLFPTSINLQDVKFQAKEQGEFLQNLNLLQDSFVKADVKRVVPIEDLIKGKFKTTFEFLRWFKKFFDANHSGRRYNPLAARKGVEMTPARPYFRFSLSGKPENLSMTVVINSDSDDDNGPSKPVVYKDEWEKLFSWVKPSTLGNLYAYCKVCDVNLSIQNLGTNELNRHQNSKKHMKSNADKFIGNGTPNTEVTCSETLKSFINTLDIPKNSGENGKISPQKSELFLGPHYPEDITSTCKQTPYCIYLYGQIPVSDVEKAIIMLVGFFDQDSAKHRIRVLEAFSTSKEDSGETVTVFLTDTFKKFQLSCQNLCAFYTDNLGDHTEKICLQLKQLSPNIVSLGELYTLPDSACLAAVTEHFPEVKEVLHKIHAHYISLSPDDANLKSLFAELHDLDQSASLCQIFSTLVHWAVGIWPTLVSHFSSAVPEVEKGNFEEIFKELSNPKLKATFIFLGKALEPMRSFQSRLETRKGTIRADLVKILREASGLLRAYASSFLKPQAVMRFLKERDTTLLRNSKFYLPTADQNLGGTDIEDFLLEHIADLTDGVDVFMDKCVSFYASLTANLAAGLPLNDGLLRCMSQLLSPEGRLKVSGKGVADLAAQFGLTSSSEDSSKITDEFLEYQLAEEPKGPSNASEAVSDAEEVRLASSSPMSLEEHWSAFLRTAKADSLFRRLMFCLLALPCPPLEAQNVFAQAAAGINFIRLNNSVAAKSDHTKIDLGLDNSASDKMATKSASDRNGQKRKEHYSNRVTDDSKAETIIVDDDVIFNSREGGGARADSSLRQRPPARKLFQAGTGTWCKPMGLDKAAAAAEGSSHSSPKQRSAQVGAVAAPGLDPS